MTRWFATAFALGLLPFVIAVNAEATPMFQSWNHFSKSVCKYLRFKGAAQPPLAPTGEAAFWYDSAAQKLKVSENGGPFTPLGAAPVVAARVVLNGLMSVASGADTPIAYDTVDYDLGGLANLSAHPTHLTAPIAGVYRITVAAYFVPNVAGFRKASLAINGAAQMYNARLPVTGADTTPLLFSWETRLAGGDYVELCVWQCAGEALNVTGGMCMSLVGR